MDPMGPILVEDSTQAAPGQHGLSTWTKEDPSQKLPKHQPTPEAENLTKKALQGGPHIKPVIHGVKWGPYNK